MGGLKPVSFVLAPFLGACAHAHWPTDKAGPRSAWEASIDPRAGTRFIPTQLIVPGIWDGTRKIDLPSAEGLDAEHTTWTGPREWRHPQAGQVLKVYDRRRATPREGSVEQKMAVRADGVAMGRVYDSRFGGLTCDQEAKFPLGEWKRQEVRTFDYSCWGTRGGRVVERRRTARIEIEELDFSHEGTPHSLRFSWRFSDRDSGEILDDRIYVFSPGRGLAAQYRR